jgi:hypothetical protein
MSAFVNLFADLLLAILLVAAIASSVALSRRITRLKADESAMRKTVAELMFATETGRARHRGPANDPRRLRPHPGRPPAHRERYSADLAEQVAAGENLMDRIARIVESSRQVASMGIKPAPAPRRSPARSRRKAPNDERLSAAVTAARSLAERAAKRRDGRAA